MCVCARNASSNNKNPLLYDLARAVIIYNRA